MMLIDENMKKNNIIVQGNAISYFVNESDEYISLTDIAKYRNEFEPFSVINNWMRNRSTIDFIGLWEKINNPGFKPIEFERFRNEAGDNYFVNLLLGITSIIIRFVRANIP